jgi:N-acyl-phosphatidylethanolamine-hydrolysing phospholipase D
MPQAVSCRNVVCLTLIVLVAACSTGNSHYDPTKTHHTPEGFRNAADVDKPGVGDLLRWKWQQLWQPSAPQDAARIPRVVLDPAVLHQKESGWRVSWLGHSTVLIQIDDVNIITDPIFSARAAPFAWPGSTRATPPALTAAELPKIDAVLISHNHYDHLDEASVLALARQAGGPPRFIVPLGIERWFGEHGIASVQPLDWWQETTVVGNGTSVRIELLPSQHWSKRGLFDANANLWGSFAVRGAGASAFFAGDTGYGQLFQEIGTRAGPFDLALIPVGCYEPRWFMRNQHVNPEEAVRIHRDVGARYSVGIHWGAFRLCDEPVEAPLDELPKALAAQGVAPETFQLWAVGERRRVFDR